MRPTHPTRPWARGLSPKHAALKRANRISWMCGCLGVAAVCGLLQGHLGGGQGAEYAQHRAVGRRKLSGTGSGSGSGSSSPTSPTTSPTTKPTTSPTTSPTAVLLYVSQASAEASLCWYDAQCEVVGGYNGGVVCADELKLKLKKCGSDTVTSAANCTNSEIRPKRLARPRPALC